MYLTVGVFWLLRLLLRVSSCVAVACVLHCQLSVLAAAATTTDLCAAVPSPPEPTLRIVSWNLYNHLAMNRRLDGRFRPHYPKPEREVSAMLAVIVAHQPDVLVVQESGGQDYMRELQSDLRHYGWPMPHRATGWGSDTVRTTAVLSRLPLAAVVVHNDLWFEYIEGPVRTRRPLLEVVMEWGGGTWQIFNIHLKSPHTVRRDDPQARLWRAGEVAAVRDRVLQRHAALPHVLPLVVGDWNESVTDGARANWQSASGWLWAHPLDSAGADWTFEFRRTAERRAVDGATMPGPTYRHLRAATIIDDATVALASDHRPLLLIFGPTKRCLTSPMNCP
jgi:endonuclease/exonuclease/phosphatase family metal-dependent hydrolase